MKMMHYLIIELNKIEVYLIVIVITIKNTIHRHTRNHTYVCVYILLAYNV